MCCIGSLHQNLSSSTPTSSGEYPPNRPSHFLAFKSVSTTTRPRLFCYSPCLHRLGLLGQFHIILSHLHLPRKRHSQKFRVETIQGKPLGRGWVKFRALPLKLRIGNFHEEEITFLVLERPTADIILGCPWLVLHSPEIRWDPCEVTRWREHCHNNCLTSLPTPLPKPSSVQVASTLIESPEP